MNSQAFYIILILLMAFCADRFLKYHFDAKVKVAQSRAAEVQQQEETKRAQIFAEALRR